MSPSVGAGAGAGLSLARRLDLGQWESEARTPRFQITPRLGAQALGAKSDQSADSWVFIRSDVIARRAASVWNGEIFLACIPGSPIEGGAQKLPEDRAGGAGGRQIPGFCKKRGAQGAGLPEAQNREGLRGPFSGRLWGPKLIDGVRKQAEAEGREACPG